MSKQEMHYLHCKQFFLVLLTFLMAVYLLTGCTPDTLQPNTNDSQFPLSKLSDIQDKIFTKSCALGGCHGTSDNQADLLLIEGESYSNLVNIQSLLFPEFKRVVPDSSSRSLIIKILKGEVSPQMPLDADPLPAATIDSIAAWIDNGALNN